MSNQPNDPSNLRTSQTDFVDFRRIAEGQKNFPNRGAVVNRDKAEHSAFVAYISHDRKGLLERAECSCGFVSEWGRLSDGGMYFGAFDIARKHEEQS